jgi:hypothetical protein
MAYYCLPSDLLQDGATITVTAGTEDTAYPRTNLQDRIAHTVSKFTGSSGTFRATFGGAKTLQAVAFINTNATAIQLTNGAGLNQAVSIPSTPEDGLFLDPWIDLRALANTSSTQWNVALTGPAGVALGELLLVQTLRTLKINWDPTPEEAESHPAIVHRTEYGVKLKYGLGVRVRAFSGTTHRDTAQALTLSLARGAEGTRRNFLLVVDESVNDARYVDLATDLRIRRTAPGIAEVPLSFDEQQKGWL